MAVTVKSKVKDIIENPEALAIVQKHLPSFDPTNLGMKAAYGMTLKALLAFPQTKCPKDAQVAIASDLEAANIE